MSQAEINYGNMTIPSLKALLRERDLPVGGSKGVLITRLREYDLKREQEEGWWRLSIVSLTGKFTEIRCKDDWNVQMLINEYCRVNGAVTNYIRGFSVIKYDFDGISFEENIDSDKTLGEQGIKGSVLRLRQSMLPIKK